MRSGASWSNWGPREGPDPHLECWAPRGDAAYPPPGGRSPPSSHHLAACTSLVRRQTTVTGGVVAPGRNTSPKSHPHASPHLQQGHTCQTRSPGGPRPSQVAMEQPRWWQEAAPTPLRPPCSYSGPDLARRGPGGFQQPGLNWKVPGRAQRAAQQDSPNGHPGSGSSSGTSFLDG